MRDIGSGVVLGIRAGDARMPAVLHDSRGITLAHLLLWFT